MAPGLTNEVNADSLELPIRKTAKSASPEPLKLTGALNGFKHEDSTPVIGREYLDLNIVDDLLNAANSDELLRELAIISWFSFPNRASALSPCYIGANQSTLVSRRGVVFFRAQDNLTDGLQKQFVHRLGQLAGKPDTSTLHIHPVLNNTAEFSVPDAEISTISSLSRKKMFKFEREKDRRRYDAADWHSDIQFEPVPADYTSLRLTELPTTGGDTLWASGYEIYDRFSRPYQKLFESLTATFIGDGFIKAAAANPDKVKIYEDPRGSPLNVGRELSAVHPVVRTNPVTGWKSIFAIGPFPKYINELNSQESEQLLKNFHSIITENHDLQVRFKWRNKNDIG